MTKPFHFEFSPEGQRNFERCQAILRERQRERQMWGVPPVIENRRWDDNVIPFEKKEQQR